jgi:C4-dicarboxylate transporter, DctM subunit
MTPTTIGFIGLGILMVLLFTGMPLGFVMALVGFLGFAYIKGFPPALAALGAVPYRTFADYGFSVAPLFILMGEFCFVARLSTDLYDTAYKWSGQLPGGLAIASIGACAGFAAICGSSVATAATLGTVALPEMKRYRYDPTLATGCIACGGTLGVMIPPSIAFIIYGIITEQSIGKLFIAGIFPGILQAIMLITTVGILCRRNPLLGLPGPKTSLKAKIVSLKNTWVVVLLFVLIMGGLYGGIFSPTEAAGVGAFGAFVFALARKRLTFKYFNQAIFGTVRITSMTFIIIAGALVFGYFLAVSRLPAELSNMILQTHMDRYLVLSLILVLYLFLGCVMDTIAMTLLTVPIFYPLILASGFDPIWFGVMVTLMAEIGLITPPVGINVFVIKGIAGNDMPMYTVFRGIAPFLTTMLCLVVILVVFPQIATFLPNAMK